jgi:hypothetical protein
MSMQKLLLGLANKKLSIKKAGNVTGSVYLHFYNPKIPDLVLNNSEPVDLFAWTDVTVAEIKRSNLEQHVMSGDIVLLV